MKLNAVSVTSDEVKRRSLMTGESMAMSRDFLLREKRAALRADELSATDPLILELQRALWDTLAQSRFEPLHGVTALGVLDLVKAKLVSKLLEDL